MTQLQVGKTSIRSNGIKNEVAIVGYAASLPGAPNTDAFWQVLLDGRTTIGDIPSSRWSSAGFDDPDPASLGKSYSRAAGVLEDPFGFDPEYFGISRREAEQMDPQQRVLLETTARAFDHAGIDPSDLDKPRTGVFVGASSSDHSTTVVGSPEVVGSHFMLGNTLSIFSNRLSYQWDFKGPSLTVDTACSSSMFALDLARRALASGEIDTAVVAGANMLLSPLPFIGFSRANMLSRRGVCAPFSAQADGYVRSEGAVTFILQRRSIAELNRLCVRSVLATTAVNSDGATNGLPLPSSERQRDLMQSAIASAGIAVDDVAFVEAHGTGTAVGDPREAAAISAAYAKTRSNPLPIGSAKANFGHLEPAAGLVGLLKAQLSLETGVLPSHLVHGTLSKEIDFDRLRLTVPVSQTELSRRDQGWFASVNSFGFGGANAHAILKQIPQTLEENAGHAIPEHLLITAASKSALRSLVKTWHSSVSRLPNSTLASSIASANRRIARHGYRVCLPAGSRDVLSQSLEEWLDAKATPGRAVGDRIPVGFVFSGNGTAWPGMARELMAHNSRFQETFREAASAFSAVGIDGIEDTLFRPDLGDMLHAAEVVQPLIFSIQVAFCEALAEVGVTPDACLGHSVGEFAAAVVAKRMSVGEAARIIAKRCEAFAPLRGTGTMAALNCKRSDAETLISSLGLSLDIAAQNAPGNVTVSGSETEVSDLLKAAKQKRIIGLRLKIDYPYHSRSIRSIADVLSNDLGEVNQTFSDVAFYSGSRGERADSHPLDNDYWLRNATESVEFAQGVSAMAQDGVGIFLEIGPRSVLQGNLRDILRNEDGQFAYMGTMEEGRTAPRSVYAIASRVVAAGGRISEVELLGPRTNQVACVPDYPFEREILKLEPSAGFATAEALIGDHSILGRRISAADWNWKGSVSGARLPWLLDHRLQDQPVLPAMAIVDVFRHAASEITEGTPFDLVDIELLKPVLLDGKVTETWTSYHTGTRTITLETGTADNRATIARAGLRFGGTWHPGKIEADAPNAPVGLYEKLSESGLNYGPMFARVSTVSKPIGDSVDVRLNEIEDIDAFAERVTGTDALLHGLSLLAQDDTLRVPSRISRARFADFGKSVQGRVAVDPRSGAANVLAADEAGNVVMELEGLRLSRFPVERPTEVETYTEVLVETNKVRGEDFIRSSVIAALADADEPANDLDVVRFALSGRLAWNAVFGNETESKHSEIARSWLVERGLAENTTDGLRASGPCPWPELNELLSLLVERFGYASDELAAALRIAVGKLSEGEPAHSRARRVAENLIDEMPRKASTLLLAGDVDNAILRIATEKATSVTVAVADASERDLLVARLEPKLNFCVVPVQELPPGLFFDVCIFVLGSKRAGKALTFLVNAASLAHETVLVDETSDMLASMAGAHSDGYERSQGAGKFAAELSGTSNSDASVTLRYASRPPAQRPVTDAPCLKVIGESPFARTLRDGLPDTSARDRVVVLPDSATNFDRLQAFQNYRDELPSGATVWVIERSLSAFRELCSLRRVLANEARIDVRVVAVDPKVPASDLMSALANSHDKELQIKPDYTLAPRVQRKATTSRLTADSRRLLVENASTSGAPFKWTTVPADAPGEAEIEIAIEATGVNFRDVMLASRALPEDAFSGGITGRQFGMECAGTVLRAGQASGFDVGDRVAAFAPDAFSNRTVVSGKFALKLPEHLSCKDGATIPVAFLTAAYSLQNCAKLEKNETVLIHGGAGGVGMAAIQIAKAMGLRVFATAGSPEKRLLLEALSVDAVMDSRSISFRDDVMALTNGRGVDAVLNSLAGQLLEVSLECLAPFGRFIELGKRDIFENSRLGMRALRNNVSLHIVDANQLLLEKPDVARQIMQDLARSFASSTLFPLPYREFRASDFSEAVETMLRARHIGKIVVTPEREGVVLPAAPTIEGAWLLTGATRGFGLATARWLASKGATSLWLVSRTGEVSENAMTDLAECGVEVFVRPVDIADAEAVEALMSEIKSTSGRLSGLIHGAAVFDDRPIDDCSETTLSKVYRPKVDGAKVLDALTREEPPEHFWLYGSVASMIGNPGQAVYAAANGALEDIARQRDADGFPALSISWPAIQDTGHLAEREDLRERIEASGVRPLMANEALDHLLQRIPYLDGETSVAIGALDWKKLSQFLTITEDSQFSALSIASTDGSTEAFDLDAYVAEHGQQAAISEVAGILRREIALLLRLPEERLELTRPLSEIGFDSLMAMQLLLAIEERLGSAPSANVVGPRTTLQKLAEIIVGRGTSDEADSTAAAMAERHLKDTGISDEERDLIVKAAVGDAT